MQTQVQSIEIILTLSSKYIQKRTTFTATAITSCKLLSPPVWFVALASSLVSPKSIHSPKVILLESKSDHDIMFVQNFYRFPMSLEQKPAPHGGPQAAMVCFVFFAVSALLRTVLSWQQALSRYLLNK